MNYSYYINFLVIICESCANLYKLLAGVDQV